MKLTDLKCPRCSGLLNQQCDKFYCSSCGAAFEVDYEDTDVEYSRLLTEADRTRMMIERDKEVLKKDFEFREAYKDEEARRKAQYEIQKRTRTAVSALVTTVITFSMMFILMIGLIVYIITVRPELFLPSRSSLIRILSTMLQLTVSGSARVNCLNRTSQRSTEKKEHAR